MGIFSCLKLVLLLKLFGLSLLQGTDVEAVQLSNARGKGAMSNVLLFSLRGIFFFQPVIAPTGPDEVDVSANYMQ